MICIAILVLCIAIFFGIKGRSFADFGLTALWTGTIGLIIASITVAIASAVVSTPLVKTEKIMINDASEFRVQPYIDLSSHEDKRILVRVDGTSTSAMEYVDLITISGDSFYVTKRTYHLSAGFFTWTDDFIKYDLNIPAKAISSFK